MNENKNEYRERVGDHMIHFEMYPGEAIYFHVYNVQDWKHLPTGKEGFSYVSKETGHSDIEEFDSETCQYLFRGSYRWRGVWEGRIYFPAGEEYWGDALREMTDVYQKFIVPNCRLVITSLGDPGAVYDIN